MTQAQKIYAKQVMLILLAIAVMAFVAYGLYRSQQHTQEPLTLQGQMQWQQTSIASKVAGRIATVLVTEGEMIDVGQPLIEMDSPEIDAKFAQAEAGRQMAQSQLDKAENGARPQEIAQAKASMKATQAEYDLVASTYERINRLYQEGLMSRQQRDEAHTKYLAVEQKLEASKQQYDLAKTGARAEDKAAAKAQVAQVDAMLQEAQVAQDEANLKSPIAGLVDSVLVSAGEVVGQGVPILSVVNPDEQWVVLNVTENHLNQFGIGQQFEGNVPALSTPDAPYTQTFEVFASSMMSDFATWRPTNAEDGFDVRTFEVKARPLTPDVKLRSGMSVLIELDASAQ